MRTFSKIGCFYELNKMLLMFFLSWFYLESKQMWLIVIDSDLRSWTNSRQPLYPQFPNLNSLTLLSLSNSALILRTSSHILSVSARSSSRVTVVSILSAFSLKIQFLKIFLLVELLCLSRQIKALSVSTHQLNIKWKNVPLNSSFFLFL